MKVLVIRLSSLGDVVLTTPALDSLRKSRPEAFVSYLSKPGTAALLQGHPSLNEAWPMDTRGEYKGLGGILRMAARIRGAKFDAVLDLHGNLRSRVLSALSGARVFRVKNDAFKRRMKVWMRHWKLQDSPPVALRAQQVVARLLGEASPSQAAPSSLKVASGAQAWAANFLNKAGWKEGQPLLAISPGAAWATKRWSPESFAEVLGNLAGQAGLRVLFIGDARDAALAAEIMALRPRAAESCIVAAGKTDLQQLAALLARCRALLSNDSGPMHVATALGVPVVALFGPTVEAFGFFPEGPRDRVLQKDLACRPCSVHGTERCPLGTHECMKSILPAEVLAALNEVLQP
jgi:heptosyltransferase-2